MKKSFKYALIGLIVLSLLWSFGSLKTAKAESGWDNDYDSGGSWDSDSSWDYDNDDDWNSGSSWNDKKNNYYDGESNSKNNWNNHFNNSFKNNSFNFNINGDVIFFAFLFAVIIITIILANNLTNSNKINNHYKNNALNQRNKENNNELTDDEINKIDSTINKQKLYHQCFKLYKDIQIAWMNFDYDSLKKYTTDELYHMYESQLKVLDAKHQQNIMSDIEFVSAKIINITIDNGVEKVKLYLNTITRDYVINDKKEVIRGNDKIRNSMEYIITLNRNIEKQNITNCPSCGAKIDIVAGGKCPYCDSVIVNNNNEFVMSKKECIGQRRI